MDFVPSPVAPVMPQRAHDAAELEKMASKRNTEAN